MTPIVFFQYLGNYAKALSFKSRGNALARGLLAMRGPFGRAERRPVAGVRIIVERNLNRAKVTIIAAGGVTVSYEFHAGFDFYIRPVKISYAAAELVGGIGSLDLNNPGDSIKIFGRITRTDFINSESRPFDGLQFDLEAPLTELEPKIYQPPDVATLQKVLPEDTWVPNGYQRQRGGQYVWWDKNDATRYVVSPAGVGHLNGTTVRGMYAVGTGLFDTHFYQSDQGFDIYPTLHTGKDSAQNIAGGFESDSWWRRVALQTVTDPIHGTRTFVVATDRFGRFRIYPLSATAGLVLDRDGQFDPNETVPLAEIKTATVAWPSWVYQHVAGDDRVGEIYWTFNSDGTRAVTCPIQRLEPTNGAAGSVQRIILLRDPRRTQTIEDGILFRNPDDVSPGGEGTANANGRPLHNDKPGLIEVSIDIELTGSSPEDFTVAANIQRSQHDDGRYYVSADYAFADPRLQALGIEQDDLISCELDIFYWSEAQAEQAIGVEPAKGDDTVNPPFVGIYRMTNVMARQTWVSEKPDNSTSSAHDERAASAELYFYNNTRAYEVWRMPLLLNGAITANNVVFSSTWGGFLDDFATCSFNVQGAVPSTRDLYQVLVESINCRNLAVVGLANQFEGENSGAVPFFWTGFVCAYGALIREDWQPRPGFNYRPGFEPKPVFRLDRATQNPPASLLASAAAGYSWRRLDCQLPAEVGFYNVLEMEACNPNVYNTATVNPDGHIAVATLWKSAGGSSAGKTRQPNTGGEEFSLNYTVGSDIIGLWDSDEGRYEALRHRTIYNSFFLDNKSYWETSFRNRIVHHPDPDDYQDTVWRVGCFQNVGFFVIED